MPSILRRAGLSVLLTKDAPPYAFFHEPDRRAREILDGKGYKLVRVTAGSVRNCYVYRREV